MEVELQPRRVLVTGAAGFIGSHVVERLLEEGHSVWGVDNFDPFYSPRIKESNLESARAQLGFHLAEGDLRDEAFLRALFREGQFDVVIHLAAKPGVRPSIEAAEEYYDCNVMGSVRLLETMRRYQVGGLVFASCASVYGASQESRPFCEDDPVGRPLSPYAATKRAGELLCHTYWRLHGLRSYCLRLFTVYGPKQRPDHAIYKFTRALLEDRPLTIFGDGTAQRDFTYIDDVADAIYSAFQLVGPEADGAGFEILNIGSNRAVSVNELVRLLSETLEAEPEIKHAQPQPGELVRTWADIGRAGAILGYRPKVAIEEGLARFVAWLNSREEMELATRRL